MVYSLLLLLPSPLTIKLSTIVTLLVVLVDRIGFSVLSSNDSSGTVSTGLSVDVDLEIVSTKGTFSVSSVVTSCKSITVSSTFKDSSVWFLFGVGVFSVVFGGDGDVEAGGVGLGFKSDIIAGFSVLLSAIRVELGGSISVGEDEVVGDGVEDKEFGIG